MMAAPTRDQALQRVVPAAATTPQPLVELGFWRVDEGDDTPGRCDPRSLVELPGQATSTERAFTAAYLRSGMVESVEHGYSYCRFQCAEAAARPRVMGCAALTDGVYVWPEGLAHYVETHGVRLPSSLLEHMRSQTGAEAANTGGTAAGSGLEVLSIAARESLNADRSAASGKDGELGPAVAQHSTGPPVAGQGITLFDWPPPRWRNRNGLLYDATSGEAAPLPPGTAAYLRAHSTLQLPSP
jgi:hypothetical protein